MLQELLRPSQPIGAVVPICAEICRIHPAYLAWVMEALVNGEVLNQVSVDAETTHWARVALERMVSLTPSR
jgi:quinolinate synthase